MGSDKKIPIKGIRSGNHIEIYESENEENVGCFELDYGVNGKLLSGTHYNYSRDQYLNVHLSKE